MAHTDIETLVELLRKLPGVGVRQARRIAYFIMRSGKAYAQSLSDAVTDLAAKTALCGACNRLFEISNQSNQITCSRCGDSSYDDGLLMIVHKEVDLESIEMTGGYLGRFFVLGSLLPLTTRSKREALPIDKLQKLVKKHSITGVLKEIICALPVTAEGEATTAHLKDVLRRVVDDKVLITELGRGLSTGTELEYIDRSTLEGALRNRA
jgi:recombination protein RecR